MRAETADPGQRARRAGSDAAAAATPAPPGPLALRTALMFVQIFGIVASFTLTKAVRDAVFLANFGMKSLAYVSLLLAVLAGLGVALHQRFVAQRFSRGNAAAVTLFGVALSLVGFFGAIKAGLPGVPWTLYVWSGIFGLFLVAQFWIMALDVFDAREAKRVFAVLAAGASLGGVLGGYAAKELSNNLGEDSLLLLVAATLAGCGVLARVGWTMRPREIASSSPAAATRPQLLEGVTALRQSPLLRTAALVLLCSIVAGTLLDWQIKSVAKAYYHSDREQLTHFFGKMLAFASVLALALQCVTGALLRRVGVAAGLLVLPAAVLAGALLFIGQAHVGLSLLGVALAAKTAEGGVRFSVDKAAIELLYLPIQGPMRAAGKGLVDTVADRVGGAITAAIWLVLQATVGVEDPARVRYASYVIIGIIALWAIAALSARARYLGAFREGLSRLELRPERLTGRIADAGQRSALVAALGSARTAEVLLALDVLADPQQRHARVDLAAVLRHPNETVRSRALEVLAMRRDALAALPAARLLVDPSPVVRVAAVRWALAAGPARILRAIAERSGAARPDEESVVPPAALQVLETAALAPAERGRALGAMARSTQAADRAVAAVLAAGTHERALFEALRDDADPRVANAAIAAIAAEHDPRDVPELLRAATRARTRLEATAALASFGVAPGLVGRLADTAAPLRERCAAADALARTRRPDAIAPLVAALVSAGGELRYRVIKALDKLKRDTGAGPDQDWVEREVQRELVGLGRLAAAAFALESAPADEPAFALVARAACEAIDRGIERIFRILALLTTPKEMRDVYLALRDAPARSRAACVEYLDNVLPPVLRGRVVPVVEPAEPVARRRALVAAAEAREVADPQAALGELAAHDEPWLRAAAAAALLRTGRVATDVPHRDAEDDPRVQRVFAEAG